MRLERGEVSKRFASVVVAAVTLWGSRLIVMVANILGKGGGGSMDALNNYTKLKPWVLEIQAMGQIHCNLSLNAGVVGGGRLVIRKFI